MSFNNDIQNSKILEAKALETCNNEPIAIPGRIQDYGALIAFNVDTLEMTYVSENITDYFDVNIKTIFNLSILTLFTPKDFHDISNIASHKATFSQRKQVKTTVLHTKKVDLSLFRVDANVVIEIIPLQSSIATYSTNSHLKWILDSIKSLDDVQDILEQSVAGLKNITQFDRVKAYMFHPDNSGEVVAEHNNGEMDSFLGLHFPASDIPPVARQLFSKIAIRYIENVNGGNAALLAHTSVKDIPLNLTLSLLRGNSPVHNQYLKNMEVSSTLSLPIIVKGNLWGLFALHHKEVIELPSEILYTAELIGQIAGMVLTQKIQHKTDLKLKKLHLKGDEFITLNQNNLHLQKFWEAYAVKLKSLLDCDGVCYQIEDKLFVYKSCPPKNTILSIAKEFKKNNAPSLYHSSNLAFDTSTTKGVLALCIHLEVPKVHMYFFRNEIEQNISWAGNPKKDIEFTKENVRLHPRSSFNIFKETNKGHSKLWDSETLYLAEAALLTFQKAAVTEKATTARLNTVVRELSHRLRNILALVRSISRQTANDNITIESYVNSLEQRIIALAKANNLLTDSFYNAVEIRIIFESVILSLCDRPEQLHLKGDSAKISSEVMSMLVLIIHELTTNAIKYGAFSQPNGQIAIKWYKVTNGLIIEWKELGGPKVNIPTKKGFGTSIIENAIKYEFDGASEVHYLKDGILAKFTIPAHLIGENEAPMFVLDQIENTVIKIPRKKAKRLDVLILEDDFINAQDLRNMISKLDINSVSTFSNQKDALNAMNATDYHLALLDVNLKQETCLNIAKICHKKNIPFYYITGYGSSFLKGNGFPKAPVILKPLSTQKITDIINHHI